MALTEDYHEEDTQALVERARWDPEAFAQLYRLYAHRIHAFAYRRSRSLEVAEEITSATFERALAGLPGFRWRGGGFEPWLYRIAATETAAFYRRTRRSEGRRAQLALRDLAPTTTGPAHDGDADDQLRVDRVMAAMSRLRPRYQEAISLRYLLGLSHEEAASASGSTKPVFAVTLHRALAALRRELGRAKETDR